MKILQALYLLLAIAGANHAQNVVVNLLVPVQTATPGGEVRVDPVILNPTPAEGIFETPLTLGGTLSNILPGQQDGDHGQIMSARAFDSRESCD